MNGTLPQSIEKVISMIKEKESSIKKVGEVFAACFPNTYETTLKKLDDDSFFVKTGDIPAMWLRDSAAQVRPYLILAEEDKMIQDMIAGVIKRQMMYINHDPYANAFNETENEKCYHRDDTEMTSLEWERKYEIDSLCYPIQLAYLFWKTTGRTDHFDEAFVMAVQKVLGTWTIEQHHAEESSYYFRRSDCPEQDTLSHNGNGAPVTYTGMTWSGFRPSDDACQYGYLIPANMFAVVVLRYLNEIATDVLKDEQLAARAIQLADEIDEGIQQYGKIEHETFGTIYAYETDGQGHYTLMDDANVPSLLAIPYFGYLDATDPVYQNTRQFILSKENPYYYDGKFAKGVGSPHTPTDYIWPIALSIQGMTSVDEKEKQNILQMLITTDAGTNQMHEGFDVNKPSQYTREWFAWANAMYSEFVLHLQGIHVTGSPLDK